MIEASTRYLCIIITCMCNIIAGTIEASTRYLCIIITCMCINNVFLTCDNNREILFYITNLILYESIVILTAILCIEAIFCLV